MISGNRTSSPPDGLAEVLRADPDLLALEFDAIVAANYPDLAGRPQPRPPRRTPHLLTRRLPPSRPSRPVRRTPSPFVDEQAAAGPARARQRSPPVARPTDRSSAQEVMA